jgi:hypothetical protein
MYSLSVISSLRFADLNSFNSIIFLDYFLYVLTLGIENISFSPNIIFFGLISEYLAGPGPSLFSRALSFSLTNKSFL